MKKGDELYDHAAALRESIMGAPPKAEDDYNTEETRVARKAGAVADDDPDLFKLHAIMDSAKGFDKDADVTELRTLVRDANAKRLHEALDRVLDRVRQRRCAGDRKFLKNFGIRE